MSVDSVDETSGGGDFDAVYQAVSETARGRWFIQEFLKRSGSANTQLILDAIKQLGAAPAQPVDGTSEVLRRELTEMSKSISQTRQEIAAIQPTGTQNTNSRILEATGELDGIVTATERATSDILGAAENIQNCVERLRANEIAPDVCDDVEAQIMDIFTACSFQDITGQRTTKVINVMRYLEQRVNAMINVWDPDAETDGQPLIDPQDTRPDAHLLNGPQPEGEGHDQDAIDALMSGFDDAPADVSADDDTAAGEASDDVEAGEIAFDAPSAAIDEAVAATTETNADDEIIEQASIDGPAEHPDMAPSATPDASAHESEPATQA